MLFLSRIPGPPLDAYVASIWYCENDPRPRTLERVLPSGAAQLIVNLKEDQTRVYRPESGYDCLSTSGTVLCGVQSRYCIIDTAEQECVLGVVFKPNGTGPFFRMPAYEASDSDIALDLLWGRRSAGELREQLLAAPGPVAKLDRMEHALREAFQPANPHPAVAFALETFAQCPDQAKVGTLSDVAGLSAKRFIERFKAEVGLTPKHFCRILRFQRALGWAERGYRVDWTRIAVDCGYFDQAHFIHDFRSFAGITPTVYQSARTEYRNHVKFLQSS